MLDTRNTPVNPAYNAEYERKQPKRHGSAYTGKRIKQSPWRTSNPNGPGNGNIPYIQIANPLSLLSRRRCQSAATYPSYSPNGPDHATFVKSLGNVESLNGHMQNLRVVGKSMGASSTQSDLSFVSSKGSFPKNSGSRNRSMSFPMGSSSRNRPV